MSLTSSRIAILAALCLWAAACSPSEEQAVASPVATPSVTVPQRATIGRVIDVSYRFTIPPAAPPFSRDYTVFVHAMNEEGTRVWTSDHQPPQPTTRWEPGTVIEYTEPMRVPRSAKPGRVTLQIGLYRPDTRDRLPLSGESAGKRSYRVATFEVQPAPAGHVDALFAGGWHGVEVSGGAQGVEWRWSKRDATVLLRNPKRDAVVLLDLDQPVDLDTPQRVEVRVGAQVVDTFEAVRGQVHRRRIPVPAATLGTDEFTRVTLGVDRTFVPAGLPKSSSTDVRELGVRVFAVEISPEAAAGSGG